MNLIGIVLRLHAWHSNTDNERQVVSDYRDYQKIDDFYSVSASRNCYLLQNQISDDILNILNNDCVNKATTAYTGIDWRKFHKLDLVLLTPAIILGSLIITTISILINISIYKVPFFIIAAGLLSYFFHPFLPPVLGPQYNGRGSVLLTIVIVVILRSIISFFIIRLTLKATQGIVVNNYGLQTIFRSFPFFLFSFVIVGIVPVLSGAVLIISQPLFFIILSIQYIEATIAFYVLDIGCMFLLTWVVWRHYMKHKAGLERKGTVRNGNSQVKRSPI
jgi:hypothetical protein